MAIPKEKLLEMYRNLVRARALGEELYEILTTEGSNMMGLHQGVGEEAIPVAVIANLKKSDYYKPSGVRMHPYLFCKEGFTMRDAIASECGRDLPKVGGHSTYCSPELGVIGKSGVLGEDGPMYLGPALAAMIKKSGQVTVYTCGDGTGNRAPIHESMAMAAALNLPIVFMIENNQYGMGTSVKKSYKIKDLSDRAKGYGFPGQSVDGNDVIALYEVVKEYVGRARSGGGPGLIVAETYRLGQHNVGSDPQLYRPKGEAEEWWKKDPLPRYQKRLMEMGILSDEDIKKTDAEAKAEADKAGKDALEVPFITYEDQVRSVPDVL
jgi:pyruvate dehydrogenase E1 component alpha subunit